MRTGGSVSEPARGLNSGQPPPPRASDAFERPGFEHVRRGLRLLASTLGASEAELVVRTADVQVRLGTGRPDHPAQGRREEVTVAAGAAHDGGQLCLWWPHAAVDSDPQLLSLSLPAGAALLGCLLDSDLERAVAAERGEQASLEARTDALTGLGNRRAWEAALRTEASRARREQRALAVVVVDLDGLKLVNDAAGHLAGDDLLRKAGAVLTGGRPHHGHGLPPWG